MTWQTQPATLSGVGTQAYEYEQLAVHEPSGVATRVFVHADTSYESQAYATISAWTSEGWKLITTLPTNLWYSRAPYSRGDAVKVQAGAWPLMQEISSELYRKAHGVLITQAA